MLKEKPWNLVGAQAEQASILPLVSTRKQGVPALDNGHGKEVDYCKLE